MTSMQAVIFCKCIQNTKMKSNIHLLSPSLITRFLQSPPQLAHPPHTQLKIKSKPVYTSPTSTYRVNIWGHLNPTPINSKQCHLKCLQAYV